MEAATFSFRVVMRVFFARCLGARAEHPRRSGMKMLAEKREGHAGISSLAQSCGRSRVSWVECSKHVGRRGDL